MVYEVDQVVSKVFFSSKDQSQRRESLSIGRQTFLVESERNIIREKKILCYLQSSFIMFEPAVFNKQPLNRRPYIGHSFIEGFHLCC